MATKQQLDAVRPQALAHPNIGKHGKRKTTLQKEDLRKKFVAHFGSKLPEIMDLMELYMKKGKTELLLETLRQLIGSPEKDKGGDTNINVERGVFVLPSEIIEKYKLNEPTERV